MVRGWRHLPDSQRITGFGGTFQLFPMWKGIDEPPQLRGR